jgi:hypothetical protein
MGLPIPQHTATGNRKEPIGPEQGPLPEECSIMNNLLIGCYAAADALSICDCWLETHKTLIAVGGRAISPMRYHLACCLGRCLDSATSSLAFPSCKESHHSVTSVKPSHLTKHSVNTCPFRFSRLMCRSRLSITFTFIFSIALGKNGSGFFSLRSNARGLEYLYLSEPRRRLGVDASLLENQDDMVIIRLLCDREWSGEVVPSLRPSTDCT